MQMPRINAALIGSGNIGTDLMYKALRSDWIKPTWMVGIDSASDGLSRARNQALNTTADGVDGLLPHIREQHIQIAFDATSAQVHAENSRKLQAHGVVVIDLTPAAIGPFCVPSVNLAEQVGRGEMNLNMVSCGGQATIPVVAAVSRVQQVAYAEIVATVSSRSAGPGTRKNIDEFTRTTAAGLEKVGGARNGKAIIILNPAEPPLIMRDTVYCLTEDEPDRRRITDSIRAMTAEVQRYVPGYTLKTGSLFEDKQVSVYLQVAGRGDYLPEYAGNLDIMTAAALRTGEMIAQEILSGRFNYPPISAGSLS